MSRLGVYRFCIKGPPVPKARPRVTERRTYTPKGTIAYERSVHVMARVHKIPRLRACHVAMTFFLPTKRRVDIDNLIKAVLDGLNGAAYEDDSAVFSVAAAKKLDREQPRTMIEIYPLNTSEVW